jgi:diketogulonate reductase-like aldo/keto reductase
MITAPGYTEHRHECLRYIYDGNMRIRKLGRTNLEVSEIGYGAWGIGGKQWLGGADDESAAALQRAIELGLNFIDTALAYGDGHSEKLVGKVTKGAKKRSIPQQSPVEPVVASPSDDRH